MFLTVKYKFAKEQKFLRTINETMGKKYPYFNRKVGFTTGLGSCIDKIKSRPKY